MKIAIVCGSPSSEFLAPFDDPAWEIWVLGNRTDRFKDKRITRIFEIHEDLTQHGDVAAYAAHLEDFGKPLIVGETFPRSGPYITPFDYARSEALYGSLYLTSSPAYMMSHAISEGATEIGIYGVDLAVDNHEYYWQRPCMEAWIGFAKGRGIKITMPDVCPVGKADYAEGRDWDGVNHAYGKKGLFSQNEFEKMARLHIDSMAAIDEKIAQLVADKHTHGGAVQAYQGLSRTARAHEAGTKINSLLDTIRIKETI